MKNKKECVQASQLNHARIKDTGCEVAVKAGLSVKCSSYIVLPLKAVVILSNHKQYSCAIQRRSDIKR